MHICDCHDTKPYMCRTYIFVQMPIYARWTISLSLCSTQWMDGLCWADRLGRGSARASAIRSIVHWMERRQCAKSTTSQSSTVVYQSSWKQRQTTHLKTGLLRMWIDV